jgi:hypothetical protein
MDWTKNAKVKKTATGKTVDRRLTVTITPEMEKVFGAFRDHYKDTNASFTDTGILMTFIEAGVRSFITDQLIPKTMINHPTPVHQND